MTRLIRFGFLTIGLIGALGTRALAQGDEARTIVEKAVQTHGGEKLLKAQAVHLKEKVTIEGKKLILMFETWVKFPDRIKTTTQFDVAGVNTTTAIVYDGKKCWTQVNNETSEAEAKVLKMQIIHLHTQRVVSLTFLKDKGYELSPLGEIKLDGRAALGVRVQLKDRPDINLYFDKATNLLAKMERRPVDVSSGQEITEERYFKDYKEAKGVKYPTRIVIHRDGKQFSESEVAEYQVLEEGFADDVFAKP